MRIEAVNIVQGTTNTAVSDTFVVSYGSDLASSRMLSTFPGRASTKILSRMDAVMSRNYPGSPWSPFLVGLASSTTQILCIEVDDATPYGSFFIRRNGAALAAGYAVLTSLSAIWQSSGRVRSPAEMRALYAQAMSAGFDAGFNAPADF